MNGDQFIRRARKWARAHELDERVEASRGKGGHVTQWIGDRFPVVKTGEIGTGLLAAMLKQIGVPKGRVLMQTWTFPARFTVEPSGEVAAAFADLPEALTGAASLPQARALAADALEEAVLAYLAAGRPVPSPRSPGDGEEEVPLAPLAAARAALAAAMREQRVSERALAGRLSQPEGAVRRLVDGAGGVTLETVLAALAALGRHTTLAVVEA